MKVSRDYVGNLIQLRKTQSLYEKRLIGPKRAVFNFFQSSMGGVLTPETPRAYATGVKNKPASLLVVLLERHLARFPHLGVVDR